MPDPAGTEGARPTNRAKDISSRNSSSLPKNFRGKISGGKIFLGDFSCELVWLCGMVGYGRDQ